MGSGSAARNQLTPRQQKWFASVAAGLERDTGKSLAEWVAIAKTCPATKPHARVEWLRETYGLGVNRIAHILSEAFPSPMGWDDAEGLRAALWSDPAGVRILEAVEAAIAGLPDVVHGQRKAFSAFSHEVQFAALRPVKGGTAMLGLVITPDLDPRLETPKNESWSERLKARIHLASPKEVDAKVQALLKAAYERS